MVGQGRCCCRVESFSSESLHLLPPLSPLPQRKHESQDVPGSPRRRRRGQKVGFRCANWRGGGGGWCWGWKAFRVLPCSSDLGDVTDTVVFLCFLLLVSLQAQIETFAGIGTLRFRNLDIWTGRNTSGQVCWPFGVLQKQSSSHRIPFSLSARDCGNPALHP